MFGKGLLLCQLGEEPIDRRLSKDLIKASKQEAVSSSNNNNKNDPITVTQTGCLFEPFRQLQDSLVVIFAFYILEKMAAFWIYTSIFGLKSQSTWDNLARMLEKTTIV
ncbi:hypothetical protein PHYBLDRAFT_162023 [Phycomyces blakesleeanus NRRL 1555(-)]|uniref:Uncharacterized protein n=1 Tax=Phycomyces blakesleeanus (strain ATCC 8743b / DSM 1359 / FGSC 10004 / NBRC 33097 / NRRL 1555) TaxID=763407 RepID=A0A167RDJ1_PHYB8|nr:hypothetical protein PHYBLDRAFT_162023 [Phycomyces blakesleeanus NRRL 1555(-)]OAD81409.1 hypothetical protein PHYBLDRAFT_162023 [Phycomyces blakesleeanus NRRL 1555(-)]|eukprot:XP_018299449.1 hypothetical protein PHYBLDRAFT_162023 [Phycomyces blakesleeanus NRRL 1555(-)]